MRATSRVRAGTRAPIAALVTALVTAAALILAGCGGNEPAAPPAAPSSPASPAPVTTVGPDGPAPGETLEEAPAVLADGRHAVLIRTIDVPGRTLTVDLVYFLTGAQAEAEFAKRFPGEEGPMNDYFVVNDNPRLRTLPVAPAVEVSVVEGDPDAPAALAFADLPAANDPPAVRLFWLTVAKGSVTRIEEQFVP
jgi:hypothetical protein